MKKVQVYFAGVDSWNRPVFKEINGKRYYCDVFNLFNYNESEDKVLAFYEQRGTSSICFKGYQFESEPDGDPAVVEILTRKQAKDVLDMITANGGDK